MSNNSNYTNNTRHISKRVHFFSNGEKFKLCKIGWFEGGLKLADIVTKNIGENYLNPRMKYIMVQFDN